MANETTEATAEVLVKKNRVVMKPVKPGRAKRRFSKVNGMELEIGKKYNVSYQVNGYGKFVVGILVSTDEQFIDIQGTRDGKQFTIAKNTIQEIREVE